MEALQEVLGLLAGARSVIIDGAVNGVVTIRVVTMVAGPVPISAPAPSSPIQAPIAAQTPVELDPFAELLAGFEDDSKTDPVAGAVAWQQRDKARQAATGNQLITKALVDMVLSGMGKAKDNRAFGQCLDAIEVSVLDSVRAGGFYCNDRKNSPKSRDGAREIVKAVVKLGDMTVDQIRKIVSEYVTRFCSEKSMKYQQEKGQVREGFTVEEIAGAFATESASMSIAIDGANTAPKTWKDSRVSWFTGPTGTRSLRVNEVVYHGPEAEAKALELVEKGIS
jgi:polyhydroxyalkanoate synthesis regulator phasin